MTHAEEQNKIKKQKEALEVLKKFVTVYIDSLIDDFGKMEDYCHRNLFQYKRDKCPLCKCYLSVSEDGNRAACPNHGKIIVYYDDGRKMAPKVDPKTHGSHK